MRRFDLGMSLNYCSEWGIVEAIREVFQNAYDEQVVHPENKLYFNYDSDSKVLIIGNKFSNLETSTLLMGRSTKRDNDETIGRHGEGYKVSAVVLARLGKTMKIHNRGKQEVWTSKVIKSRRYKEDVVVFDIEKVPFFKHLPDCDLVFEISGVEADEYRQIFESNLHLQKLDSDAYIQAGKSRILLRPEHKGKIFVGGLFVQYCRSAMYGYDFEPSLVKLDRDRGLIDSVNIQFLCSRLVCRTNDIDFMDKVKEVWDGQYMRFYLSDTDKSNKEELFVRAYNAFTSKYGEDAVACTSTDEFNILKERGINAVLLNDSDSYYVTSCSRYEASSGNVPLVDKVEVAGKLEDWFDEYIEEGSKAYIEGKKIIDDVLYLLRR